MKRKTGTNPSLRCQECRKTMADANAMQHHQSNWHMHENRMKLPSGKEVILVRVPSKDNMLRCPNSGCGEWFQARRTLKNHIMRYCIADKSQSIAARMAGTASSSRTSSQPPPRSHPVSSAPRAVSSPPPAANQRQASQPLRRPSSSTVATHQTQQQSKRSGVSARPTSTSRSEPYPSLKRTITPSSTSNRDTIDLAKVKEESTMFEIDFDDVDDGVHWTNVGDEIMMMESFVPTVDLQHVPDRVKQGDEVWAKCRIGRLGKFAVTSQGVSMDFELRPAKKQLSKGRDQPSPSVSARVETGVVESLLDQSSSALAELVARKKVAEFHEAIRQLRDTLENLGQIECRFQGMQGGLVVVREIRTA